HELSLGEPAAAGENLSAVFLRLRHGALVRLHGVFVDHRTEPDIAVERIADLDLFGLLDEQPDEFVTYRFVDVDARAGRALLSLRAERGPHHALGRFFEIGRAHDERGILAAHLDDKRARHGTRAVLANELHADVFRAGENDPVDVGVVDQLLTRGAAAA